MSVHAPWPRWRQGTISVGRWAFGVLLDLCGEASVDLCNPVPGVSGAIPVPSWAHIHSGLLCAWSCQQGRDRRSYLGCACNRPDDALVILGLPGCSTAVTYVLIGWGCNFWVGGQAVLRLMR